MSAEKVCCFAGCLSNEGLRNCFRMEGQGRVSVVSSCLLFSQKPQHYLSGWSVLNPVNLSSPSKWWATQAWVTSGTCWVSLDNLQLPTYALKTVGQLLLPGRFPVLKLLWIGSGSAGLKSLVKNDALVGGWPQTAEVPSGDGSLAVFLVSALVLLRYTNWEISPIPKTGQQDSSLAMPRSWGPQRPPGVWVPMQKRSSFIESSSLDSLSFPTQWLEHGEHWAQ